MAKGDINPKTGKARYNRRDFGNKLAEFESREKYREKMVKNQLERTQGIRSIVLDAYIKGGKNAAYNAAKIANKRIGTEAYPNNLVDKWIEEYEQVR